MSKIHFNIIALFVLCFNYINVQSASLSSNATPAIAIIIDDMGYHYKRNKEVINLPGAITLSFLPHTPYATELANFAHSKHKEILLHLPMESIDRSPLDFGGIHLDMDQLDIQRTLRNNLDVIPFAVGLNNHMGSLVSQHPGHISAMMQVISKSDLFFVDSFTTNNSVIQQIATEYWVPSIKRDIFLDNIRTRKAINRQFSRLLSLARKKGIALAIAHPYPQTLQVLKRRLKTLTSENVRLVPVSQLISIDMQRFKTWRAFLSP